MAIIKKKTKKKAPSRNRPKEKKTPANALAVRKSAGTIPAWEPKPFSVQSSPAFLDGWSGKKPEVPKAKFDPEKNFLKTFKELTYQHRAWDVWNDFVIMTACALSNPVDKEHFDEREAQYLRIIKKYSKDEQKKFPELFAHTVLALEVNPEQDFLGRLYTSLNLHDEGRQQHFTPFSVCRLMADITMENVVERVQEDGYITINDSCCGAGATLIAGVHAARKDLSKAGLNFQNHILVMAQDIDETVVLMCYIQLSLLGVAACVKVGNTLTEPMAANDTNENYWFTPMYYSGAWAMRRLIHKLDDLFQPIAPVLEKKPFKLYVELEEKDCHCSLSKLFENVAQKAHFTLSDSSRFDCTKICCTKSVQDAVYAFYKKDYEVDNLSIAMFWANSGPKANLDGTGYVVEIEDGFVMELEE